MMETLLKIVRPALFIIMLFITYSVVLATVPKCDVSMYLPTLTFNVIRYLLL